MGLRFRRSVRIVPGLRLNFSARGVSATLGPRGASVNVGPSGTYANLGLPGTGLSYRERLDGAPSHPASRSTSRSTYRGLLRELHEAERARARAEAADAHEEHKALLDRLGGVVRRRNNDPYAWDAVWGPSGAFPEEEFRIPEPAYSSSGAATAAAEALPIARWTVPVAALLASTLWLGSPVYKSLATVGVVALVLFVLWWIRSRRELASQALRSDEDEYARDIEMLRTDHRLRQDNSRDEWKRQEEARAAVRSAESRGDTEILTSVLEAELANEDLPVPLVFELEMDSPYEVRIELALPEIAEIPQERTQLTKTGKLSVRRFAQRDRVALFGDLCAGVALRLMYETFRVLPMVRQAEIFGTASGIDPASGHDTEFIALHLRTDRHSLAAINLDAADPSSVVTGLGGRLAIDRKGDLKALPGVVGLLER